MISVVFETHSISEDNEAGRASGWAHSRLSERGRELAGQLGARRRDDGIDAVFSSDLGRAVETARIAFAHTDIPVMLDWRLRECDYGGRNGGPAVDHVRDRARFLDTPYPGGESWRQAVARVSRFIEDVSLRWDGRRVLVIGHVATRWALDHVLNGRPLEELVSEDFAWREGWEYDLDGRRAGGPARVQVTLDCQDPASLAQFWGDALGYAAEFDDPTNAWGAVVDRAGRRPRLVFQRVPERAAGKARAHLDVQVGQAALASEATRLVGLGARIVRNLVADDTAGFRDADRLDDTAPTGWRRLVLADPEGNIFCLQ